MSSSSMIKVKIHLQAWVVMLKEVWPPEEYGILLYMLFYGAYKALSFSFFFSIRTLFYAFNLEYL